MSTLTSTLQEHFFAGEQVGDNHAEPVRVPRRRVRGLQVRAVPSWPLLAQLAGGAAALVGVWQEWGSPVALLVGGVAAVLVGALREAGKV